MPDDHEDPAIPQPLHDAGLVSAGFPIELQNEIWSRRSGDKADIARQTGRVFASLYARLGARDDLRVLSLGCGIEPQLAIYQALAREIFLLDIDQGSLDHLRQNAAEHFCNNIHVIRQDFTGFLDEGFTRSFCGKLADKPAEAVFLHHSLYYLPQCDWLCLLRNIYTHLLAPGGSIHCVLMSSRCADPQSTTWLYNHFAGAFCQHKNDQDLLLFAQEVPGAAGFSGAQISASSSRVRFHGKDFSELMAVVWMILLYPQVHQYTAEQMAQIICHIYRHFFVSGVPLLQEQDHLVITRPR